MNMGDGIIEVESDLSEHEFVVKRQIWEKFERRMKAWLREQAVHHSLLMDSLEMKPDVIVILRNETTLFEPQTPQAHEWLCGRCRLTSENPSGHTEFMVHPQVSQHLIAELKAAGFTVNN